MLELLMIFIFLCISVFLFFREDMLDRREARRLDLEGDLRMLKEFKKFMDEIGEDTLLFERAIAELKEELRKF